MNGKISDAANSMFGAIGAMQTLIENFPAKLFKFEDLKFSTSFDLIALVLKIIGVEREELIDVVTKALCGDMESGKNSGFIAKVEDVVKIALEANIANILNCTTNPIISNNLLDKYLDNNNTEYEGEGIKLKLAELDYMGALNKNPFYDDKFYFDLQDKNGNDYNANNIWKSKDFNAFLWYIINKSDKSQTKELMWDNRYKEEDENKRKEIIKCTYIENEYTNSDEIRVQLCSSNYYKKRKVGPFLFNKTIFEFNHEFLMSIKLYDPKVMVAEIVDYLLGEGNLSINIGLSLNEQIIQSKINEIIRRTIEIEDSEINECYYTFSNDEYNTLLENYEKNRFNVVYNSDSEFSISKDDILNNLSNIKNDTTLHEYTTTISKTLDDITASPSIYESIDYNFGLSVDWGFDLMRSLIFPFVRPLFTPKVMFLLLVNKKIMGQLDNLQNISLNELINNLMDMAFKIIKDIIVQIKDMLIDMFLNFILQKLKPLLALFASRLLLEALKMYKDLLEEILNCFKIYRISFFMNNTLDNVSYADIIIPETKETEEDNQIIC